MMTRHLRLSHRFADKNMRQTNESRARSDSAGTERALGSRLLPDNELDITGGSNDVMHVTAARLDHGRGRARAGERPQRLPRVGADTKAHRAARARARQH